MNKEIIAFIAILILILLATYYLQNYSKQTFSSSSTINPTTVKSNNTSNSSTTTMPTVTTIPVTCVSNVNTTNILNGNFSTGTYLGWNTTNNGFGNAPQNITRLNAQGQYYSSPWSGISTTYFATTYSGLIVPVGNLTSNPFQVVQPYINLQLVSPQNQELYIAIMKGNVTKIVVHFNTYPAVNGQNAASQFVNVTIPISTLICQNVRIKVVSAVVGTIATRNEYIAVANFYMSKVPVQSIGVVVNESISAT